MSEQSAGFEVGQAVEFLRYRVSVLGAVMQDLGNGWLRVLVTSNPPCEARCRTGDGLMVRADKLRAV